MFAIRKINISYIKPAKLDDLLYIKTNIKLIKNKYKLIVSKILINFKN